MNNLQESIANIDVTNNRAVVSGALNFNTVAALRLKGNRLIKNHLQLEFDFEKVTYCDSSSLALLTAWKRYAHKNHKNITFKQLPESLMAVARVSSLNKVLLIE